MNPRIRQQYDLLKSGSYKDLRSNATFPVDPRLHTIPEEPRRNATYFALACEHEEPLFFGDDHIGFHQFCRNLPERLPADNRLPGNITPNYPKLLSRGLQDILSDVEHRLAASPASSPSHEFYDTVALTLRSAIALAHRYREAALAQGRTELYNALCHVPTGPATTFLEGCITLKFVQFTLRIARIEHIGIGRFDQYMLPLYRADLARGVSPETLFETLEEFFLSLNFDSDLYTGVQQGDNGQSLMLGGYALDGTDQYNELSEACIHAALDLNLIDPKINLRVNRTTPLERLAFATRLTALGTGFPQYSNDDIVIPGLIDLGYAPDDAQDYTVAACWEFIIPGKGADFPNFHDTNYPAAILAALPHLPECDSLDAFLPHVYAALRDSCEDITQRVKQNLLTGWDRSPYLAIFLDDCIERGLLADDGGVRYRNFGFHGAGLANAADSLEAIQSLVFEQQKISASELVAAVAANFEGYESLRQDLLACDKMGNGLERVDAYGCDLLHYVSTTFAELSTRDHTHYRVGTGSAQMYIWSARDTGATPDGRLAGTPYGSSFSPAITTRLNGPLSCIRSFTKPDTRHAINGGPLTMELHDTVFRNPDGIEKTARLVKAFIDLGGHQLQLNAINRERLLDAQQHPENHKNLIVRVWGWSGYFNELHKVYQDHIIQRTEFLC